MRDELKIGALTIIALAILVFGFSFLKGGNLFSSNKTVYVLLADAANVGTASPVAMHGIKVGKVTETNYLPKNHEHNGFNVLFKLSLKDHVEIPRNSTIQIEDVDMLGTKQLRIVPSTSTNRVANGDTLVGATKGGMMAVLEEQLDEKLGPILKKAEPLLESIDTLVKNVNSQLLENGSVEKMMNSLSVSLKNFEKITYKVDGLLANQTGNIEEIIENAKTLTASIAGNTSQIDSIVGNFNTLSGKLSEIEFESIIASATASLDEVKKLMTSLNSADGTLGKLIHEDGIYDGLDSTLNSVNALLVDLKANPKRYVSFSLIARKDKSKKEE